MAAAVEPPRPRRSREPALTYGPEVVDALRRAWAVLDGPTGKRMAAAMPVLVTSMRRHGELDVTEAVAAQLVAMSAATIDRRLAADRAELCTRRGRSLTKPGSLLKSQIPMRTWADWDDHRPGFLEVDLVGHDGGDLNGQFCYTLTCTDVATGWTENRTVTNKAAKWVFAALVELQAQFRFPVLGIDSDNGSEFINHHLLQRHRAGGALDGQVTGERVAVRACRHDAGVLERYRRELVDLEEVRRAQVVVPRLVVGADAGSLHRYLYR